MGSPVPTAWDVEPRGALLVDTRKVPEEERYTLALDITRERTLVETDMEGRASRAVPTPEDLHGIEVVVRSDHHPRVEALLDLPSTVMRVERRGVEVREALAPDLLHEAFTFLLCEGLDLLLSDLLSDLADGFHHSTEVRYVRLAWS
jgi:hypothetical protein